MKLNRVDLKLSLKLEEEEELYASAFLTIQNPENVIEFMLNKELEIINVSTEIKWKKTNFEVEEYNVPEDHFLKNCRICKINLPESIHGLEELNLSVRYKGFIEGDSWGTNYLEKSRVELGLYAIYYPILNFDDKISFSLILQASEEWDWIVNASKLADCDCDIWVTEEKRIDIYLIGIPKEQAIKGDESLRFRGSKRHFDGFQELSKDLSDFEELLIAWLGKPPTEEFFLVLAPRDSGGIISRQGLISMQDSIQPEVIKKNKEILLMAWVHEMSHFWFNSTSVSSYDNWIDEGLCDYSALLLAKQKFGKKFYVDRIEAIRTTLLKEESLPAIKEIARIHPKADLLFYKYGSLIFHELMTKIGEELFRKSIRNFAQKSIEKDNITTQDLIKSFNDITKEDWTEYFENKISSTIII
ncbi:MAG: M1 family aminopeptidase [Candidatus Heimdallarchaeaceae archaeon]